MQNQIMISAMEEFKYCSDSSSDVNGKDNNLECSKDFQGIMVMEEGFEDEGTIISTEEANYSSNININNGDAGKKKRLTSCQVGELEKIFEVDSKLDQERKIKLAHELGLQPRQVAIWFQNRRARWKTKQLERDFRLLKANYESLQLNYSQIERENEGLVAQLRCLKEKLGEQNSVEMEKASITENQEVHNNYTNCNPPSSSYIIINKQTKNDDDDDDDFKERVALSSDNDHDNSTITTTNTTTTTTTGSSTGLILNEYNNSYYFNTNPIMTTSRLISSSDDDDHTHHHGLTTVLDHHHHYSSAASIPSLSSSSLLMDSSRDGGGGGGLMMMMRGYNYEQQHHKYFTGNDDDDDKDDDDDDDSCNMFMPLPADQTPFFCHFSDQTN